MVYYGAKSRHIKSLNSLISTSRLLEGKVAWIICYHRVWFIYELFRLKMSANQIPEFVDDEPPPEAPREGWTLVRIHVPELDIYKCLQFPIDKLLWDVKQQVLASLPKVSWYYEMLPNDWQQKFYYFHRIFVHFFYWCENQNSFNLPTSSSSSKFIDEMEVRVMIHFLPMKTAQLNNIDESIRAGKI